MELIPFDATRLKASLHQLGRAKTKLLPHPDEVVFQPATPTPTPTPNPSLTASRRNSSKVPITSFLPAPIPPIGVTNHTNNTEREREREREREKQEWMKGLTQKKGQRKSFEILKLKAPFHTISFHFHFTSFFFR